MSILILTPEGLYASRDRYGRMPIVIGKKDNAHCVSCLLYTSRCV